MIFDIHYQLMNAGWDPERLYFSAPKLFEKAFGASSREKISRMLSALWDPSGEKAIQFLDRAGIDKSTLLVVDWGVGLGEPEVPIEEQNRICARTARQHPDRLIPFAGIDPRRKNAVDLLKKCIEEWGMKGLKLHPDVGYYPDDETFYPFYEKVSEYQIPILSHTGPMFGALKSKYARPVYLDAVLADFPDINIIAAHMGFCWWSEATFIGQAKPNLYGCLTGWQMDALRDYENFCRTLRCILDKMGPDRVLFGTDGPMESPKISAKDWIEMIRNLPEQCPAGMTFSREEVDGILGGNACKLLLE